MIGKELAPTCVFYIACVWIVNQLISKKPISAKLLFLLAFGIPVSGRSCEPILPLYQLLSASTLAGPALVANSLPWLFAAVAIKCGAFVFLERRLSWRRAVLYMLLANVVSTIPGVLVGAFTASLAGFIIAIPIIFLLGWMVQRRVSLLSQTGPQRWVSGGIAALAFVVFFFVSVATFELAGNALEGRSFTAYWLLKFLFVAMVACVGILISAVVEESVIAWLSRKFRGNESFYTPVLRANYITLAVVLLVAALKMLPMRLHAPHFIVAWLHSLSTMLGIT